MVKPKEKVDPLATKVQALIKKGMPPKMAKVVAAKQVKAAADPKAKTAMKGKFTPKKTVKTKKGGKLPANLLNVPFKKQPKKIKPKSTC